MTQATNILRTPEPAAAGTAPGAPADGERFAGLLAGGEPMTDPETGKDPALEEAQASDAVGAGAETLLPLLDQQLAAMPTPILVARQVPTEGDSPAGQTPRGAIGTSPATGPVPDAPAGEADPELLAKLTPIAKEALSGTKAPGATPPAELDAPAKADIPLSPRAAEAPAGKAPNAEASAPADPAAMLRAATGEGGARREGKADGGPATPALRQPVADAQTAPASVEGAAPVADRAQPATPFFSTTNPVLAATGGAAQPVQPSLSEAIAARTLDLAAGDSWIDQLARDISRSTASDGSLRFRLTPETLGALDVEIVQSERGAHVRMSVSTEAAQAALAEAQGRLAAEARAQGVRIAETQVDLAGGQSRSPDREAAQAQGQSDPSQQQPRGSRGGTPSSLSGAAAEAATVRSSDRYA